MQSHLQSGAVEFLLGGTVKEKGWDSFCFSRWSPSEDYLEMLCSLVGSCVMSLGRLLVARCEQKEFKIDASVVAPVSCSCRRGAVPGRPAAAALLHASRDQRPAGPVCQTQRPACNSKTSKRCSIFIFGSGQICSLTYYTWWRRNYYGWQTRSARRLLRVGSVNLSFLTGNKFTEKCVLALATLSIDTAVCSRDSLLCLVREGWQLRSLELDNVIQFVTVHSHSHHIQCL